MPSKSWRSPWGHPQVNSWVLAEGLSPVPLLSCLSCALALCSQAVCPAACPGSLRCVPRATPGVTASPTCPYCSGGSLPSAPQVAFNKGPNEIKESNQAHGAADPWLAWSQCHCHQWLQQGSPGLCCSSWREEQVPPQDAPERAWGQLPSLPLPCRSPFLEMKDSAEAELGSGALEDGNWFPC